jgi:hypothetical protein
LQKAETLRADVLRACQMGIEALVAKTAQFELGALGKPWGLPAIGDVLLTLLILLRRSKDPVELRFEEEPSDAVVQLRLSGA